jgi:hypothetical protein
VKYKEKQSSSESAGKSFEIEWILIFIVVVLRESYTSSAIVIITYIEKV